MINLWLLLSLFVVQSVLCLKIKPEEPELTIETRVNSSFILTCFDKENITWTYPESEGSNHAVKYESNNGMIESILEVSNISYLDTGYYTCSKLMKKKTDDVANIYIYVFDEEHLLAVENDYTVLQPSEYGEAIVPCKPTSPNVTVILYNTEDSSEMKIDYDRKTGFVFKSPTVKDSKLYRCEGSWNNGIENNTQETTFHLTISPRELSAQPHIQLPGAAFPVEGNSLTLNCSVQVKMGSIVFIAWKCPFGDCANRSNEGSQLEIKTPDYKLNYKLLTFLNLSRDDAGEYICDVEDQHGNVLGNHSYYLNVFDPKKSFLDLKILTDVTNDTKRSGDPNIQWILNVTSYPRAEISCKVPNGQVINTDSSPSSKYYFSLEERLVKFVVNHLDANDSGTYEFTADNGVDKKKTVNISLYVEDKPTVLQMAVKNELSLIDEPSDVVCSVNGYPPPKITWFARKCMNYPSCEQELTELSSNDFPIKSDNSTLYMTISTLSYRASVPTMLFCNASNSQGSNSSSTPFFIGDVKDGFHVSTSLNEITVGDDVEIICQASKYIYQNNIIWHFQPDLHSNYTRVENSTDVQILSSVTKFSFRSVINIHRINKLHTGWYKCSVDYSLKDRGAKADPIWIDVKDVLKPLFIDNSTNLNKSSLPTLTVDVTKSIALMCHVRGVPKPTVVWYKDKKPLVVPGNDTEKISLTHDNQVLTIKVALREHAGEYMCEAKNKAGTEIAKGLVVIKGLPDEHHHFYYIILPAILTISLTTCIAWILVKMQKMKKLKKKLAEDGLLNFEMGAVNSLNPELGIEEQADLLPYDSRWEFPREKLKLGKQLGAGAFGVVLKAEADGLIDPNTTTTVAVKMVKRNVDALYIRALASELKIMIHLGRHLNVVNLLGACTRDINKRELVVIVEYCKYGNLHDFLLKQRSNFINQINDIGQLDFSVMENKSSIRFSTSGAVVNTSYTGTTTVESITAEETLIGSDGYLISKDVEPDWRSNYRGDYRNATVRPIKTSDLLCWSFQIARGMEYLASRKVLHGDLAARNVLLADDNIVKICDFGLAKSMYASDNYKRKKNELLPVRWMAVESIRDRVFSIQSDVWSFGITMWELFSLSITPYPGVEHLESLYTKLESGYRLEKPTYATKEIHEIMLDCWHERPTMRPLFTELSERLGQLLENGVRSHYTNLNEVYLQMNANTCNGVDYLSLLNPPVYTTTLEEPRYVNLPSIPSRESPEPDDDVELKPMLKTSDNYINANPILFSNPNYMEINQAMTPAYVNSSPN